MFFVGFSILSSLLPQHFTREREKEKRAWRSEARASEEEVEGEVKKPRRV